MKLGASEIVYLLHHVALPPQLPQQDDWSESNCDCLLQFSENVLAGYIKLGSHKKNKASLAAQKILHSMVEEMSRGAINSAALVKKLEDLKLGGK